MTNIINEVVERVSILLPTCTISTQEITKNNGVERTGLTIRENSAPGIDISPVIYIDKAILSGKSIDEIVNYVIDIYKNGSAPEAIVGFIDKITDFGQIKEYLRPRLVNKERNRESLGVLPYKDFLDLAVIAVIDIPNSENSMSIKVNEQLLAKWETNFDVIYDICMTNLEKEHCKIADISDVIAPFDPELAVMEHGNMYVLTNTSGNFGANQILKEEVLKAFAWRIHSDILAIPSSIHEWILVPNRIADSLNYINFMIKEVNQTLEEEDILSEHFYYFSLKNGWECG